MKVHSSTQDVRPAGVEPTTFGSGGQRSVQLSYGRGRNRNYPQIPEIFTGFLRLLLLECSAISGCKSGLFEGKCAPAAARAGDEFMNQVIDSIEKEQQKSDVTPFSVGDSIRVHTRVVEGDKERIQVFAGLVIGRKGRGLNETFTVRRISYGEGVERVFPLHSPRIAKLEVEQKGRARRAKLNYLRTRKGKEATAVRE